MLYPIRNKARKWGFIDHLGKVVVKPIYDSAGFFREGLTHVTEANNLIVLDSTLTQLSVMSNAIPLLYFSEGTLVFKRGQRFGLINKYGEILLEPRYDMLHCLTDGRLLAKLGGYGILDLHGEWRVEPKYWSIAGIEKDMTVTSALTLEQGVVVITVDGEVLPTEPLVNAGRCRERLLPVQFDSFGEIGWLNDQGTTVFKTREFTAIGDAFYSSTIPVRTSEGWGVVDARGDVIIPGSYLQLGNLVEERRSFQARGSELWGFIDGIGEVLVKPSFTSVRDFENGLARVSIGREVMLYIDLLGRVVWTSERG